MSGKQRKALLLIIIAAVLLAAVYTLDRCLELPFGARILLYAAPYLVAGYKVLWDAVRGIFKGQVFDEKFLMSIATIGAFALGEYPEGVMVMLFYQVGELFQSIAVGKSRRSIASLMKLRPDEGTILVDGEERTVSLEEVETGAYMLVKAGEAIPLDGIIEKGVTTIDTSALTGESLPWDAKEGDAVLGGCLNLGGAIVIRVTSVYAESTLSKILELVENTSAKKAKTEKFITKFAKYYTPAVVIGALLLAVIPSLALGAGEWTVWSNWIKRALIFLVVSCPCALVISVPLTFFGGVGGASRKGILIKGATSIETLSKVKTFVFDKTGTLTQGVFGVTKVFSTDGDNKALLGVIAAAESFSTHPIATSIVRAYGEEIDRSRVQNEREEAGFGVTALLDGEEILVGNAKLLAREGVAFEPSKDVGTIVYCAQGKRYRGYVVIEDLLKENSKTVVPALRKLGIAHTAMLTGDSEAVAQKVAKEVGLDEAYAQLLPHEKLQKLEEIMQERGEEKVAFVGDGINDAPVLMRADVGVAMGGMGTDVAIEAADVVLMKDDPAELVDAIKISKKSMRIVYENIFFALAVKFAVLTLSVFGIATMLLAIFADVGVCVLAVLNAMRALRVK